MNTGTTVRHLYGIRFEVPSGAAAADISPAASAGEELVFVASDGAPIPFGLLPPANAVSLFDRWSEDPLGAPDKNPSGVIELVADFRGAGHDHVKALLGLQRFDFPYGDVNDRLEAVTIARDAAAKLHDAFGLCVHEFLSHIDGTPVRPASPPASGASPVALSGGSGTISWPSQRRRQFAVVDNTACAPDRMIDSML